MNDRQVTWRTLLFASVWLCPITIVNAQTERPDWQRWLEKAPPTPEFAVPARRQVWEKQRRQLRTQLGNLLGRLPPRPKVPAITLLAREDHGD